MLKMLRDHVLGESGSSKAVTSTQEPNRTALSHFSLLSWVLLYISALKHPIFCQKVKMSSSSESEMSFDSDDSDINFIPGN